LFRKIGVGGRRYVRQDCRLGSRDSSLGPPLKLAATRLVSGDLLVVATNTDPKIALAQYRRRWEIERLFANLEAVVIDEFHAFIGSERGMQLQSLLHPEVEFRALTPRRTWEADGESPTVDLFRNWFDEATVIEAVEQVETHTVGDRQHLVYRFSGHDDEAPFVIEQQVYFTERDGRIDWMRMMCSGFRPQ
jgi:hypothetical protein